MQIQPNLIPGKPGVYLFQTKSGKILYIGKAKNLQKRITQYFAKGNVWKIEMLNKADKLEFIIVENEQEAILLEDNLIKKHLPPFNSLLKGDNSYTYIKIPDQKFPNIFFSRFKDNDKATYIGPKHNKKEVKYFLQLIKQITKYRGCKTSQFNQGKLCSEYFFGMCKGWCIYNKIKDNSDITNAQLQAEKLGFKKIMSEQQAIIEYQKIIESIKNFFSGKTIAIKDQIMSEIKQAIDKQHFERAAKLRDILINVEQITEKQNIVLSKSINGTFWKIKIIGEYYTTALINFYEGKIVDIIRYKEKIDDINIDNLINNIELEFGKSKELIKSGNEIYGYNSSIRLDKTIRGEIEKQIEKSMESYILSSGFSDENLLDEVLKGIQQKYNLKNYPYRIECIDISHLSGDWISGGLSCSVGGFLNKRCYKKFKLTNKSDDYANLKELIIKRFTNMGSEDKPDLLIIDGGKGQLGIIDDIINQKQYLKDVLLNTDIIGIEKGKSRKRKGKVEGNKEMIYKRETNGFNQREITYDEFDKLLLKLRDESHRFANSYRKKQMEMELK